MGTLPKRKANVVLVVGPHSSSKDLILVLACMKLTTMRFEFILEPTSFNWRFILLLFALRAKKMKPENSTQLKTECLNRFKSEQMACYGFFTNSLTDKKFNSNPFFYDLAFESKASVVLIGIDHHRKIVKFHNPFRLSGNKARDLEYINGYFENYFSYERKHNSLKR